MKIKDIKINALFFKICLLAGVFLYLFTGLLQGNCEARQLRLGAYKYLSDADMKKVLDPFTNYLSKSLKIQVKLYITSTYTELAQRFISGEMDMAMIPPYAYVKLADKIKMQLAASMKLDGSYFYNGVIVVKADSGINSIADLTKKQFAYVSPDSASGYLYPRILIKKQGLDPDNMFSKVIFSGSHAESIKSLASGMVDGISVFKTALDYSNNQGIDTSKLKIIAETEKIPHEAFIVQNNMDPALLSSLKQALITFKYSPQEMAELEKNSKQGVFKVEGWVVGLDSLYDTVREAHKYFPVKELENTSKDTNAVTIGYYPRTDIDSTLKSFAPLIEYLSKETGYKFKLAFSPNYIDVGNQLIEGNYDIGIVTPIAFVMAKEKSKTPINALIQRSTAGLTTYKGILVSKNDGKINKIEDLKGKIFAFTEPDSISGRLYPLSIFKKNGISIKTFFAKTYYAGCPKKALEDVAAGSADACACNDAEFKLLTEADPKLLNSLKVFYVTPEIPYEYWTVMENSNPLIRDKFQAAVLKINSNPQLKKELLEKIFYDGFSAPDEKGLNEIMEMLKIIL